MTVDRFSSRTGSSFNFAGLGLSASIDRHRSVRIRDRNSRFVKVVSIGTVITFAVEGIGCKRCIVGGLLQGFMMLWIGGFSALHLSSCQIVPVSYVVGEVALNYVRTAALSVAIDPSGRTELGAAAAAGVEVDSGSEDELGNTVESDSS